MPIYIDHQDLCAGKHIIFDMEITDASINKRINQMRGFLNCCAAYSNELRGHAAAQLRGHVGHKLSQILDPLP